MIGDQWTQMITNSFREMILRRSERLFFKSLTKAKHNVRSMKKARNNTKLVQHMLQMAIVNLYDLSVDILRVNDQVRNTKSSFDKFIYGICKNIATQCEDFCVIDDQLTMCI